MLLPADVDEIERVIGDRVGRDNTRPLRSVAAAGPCGRRIIIPGSHELTA